jgi:pyruvate-formate lyase
MRPLWGTFEANREHLFAQFQDTPWRPETGLAPSDLRAAVEAAVARHAHRPRVIQKAHAFRVVLTQGRIAIDPLDWFADKLAHEGLVRGLSEKWLEEAVAGPLAETAGWLHRAYAMGQAGGPRGGLDRGHIAPGWDTMLAAGLGALLARARAERARLGSDASAEQLAFYEAVEIVYTATFALARRFAALAKSLAREQPEHAERLRAVAEACAWVPEHRPRTFHEALQFVWLMHELIEMEGENVRSMGQFDRSLAPFYEADIAAGRLTRDQARELIQFFWFKYYSRTRGEHNGKNFCFAGQAADGSELTSDLTYVALEAYERLRTPDPKLSVRVLPTTPPALLRRVADLVRRGHNSFVIINDVPAVEALARLGIPVEHARLHLPIGCYEPAVEGYEVGCTMNLTVNLAKGMELALSQGRDVLSGEPIGVETADPGEFASFERVWEAYTAQMDAFLTRAAASIAAAERRWPEINPSPLVAATIADCLARGRDVGQGGPRYNSVGFVGAGLANAADSLLAIEQAVFRDGRFTMAQIVDAVSRNFQDAEPMRQYLLNRVPKWGNNDPAADAMARRVADWYCDKVESFTNGRGGRCRPSLFSLEFAYRGGLRTGALPDGRRAGESLAPGMGAGYGRDRNGVSALIASVAKIDGNRLPNGAVLDVTLHPTAVAGDDGLEALVALIRTFFAKGGYALQFNVYDVATLRDAQVHPERYATMQIRVTGWSVYFTTLTREEQELFIARTTHGL